MPVRPYTAEDLFAAIGPAASMRVIRWLRSEADEQANARGAFPQWRAQGCRNAAAVLADTVAAAPFDRPRVLEDERELGRARADVGDIRDPIDVGEGDDE